MLGDTALEPLDQISPTFLQTTPEVSHYSEKADLIDRLMQAIEEQRMVDVAYQRDPSADPAKLVLPPYGIVYHKGSLYLMAFSPEHQMVRIYKLDRVVAVELQKQHDEPDPQFDLRRQNHAEKADATIIRESLLSSHLQHKKSGTDHHRGSGIKAVRVPGLISIARDDHPVGVRRGVGGWLFQGFTPLAIHFRPFGTQNKTRCNPCPLVDAMLSIDSMSWVDVMAWVDPMLWVDAMSWIDPMSWIDATSRIRTESLIVLSRNAA